MGVEGSDVPFLLTVSPVLRRRALSVAVVGIALAVAALSRHVLGWSLPRLGEPPLVIGGVLLGAWCLLALHGRTQRAHRLEREAAALRAHALGFSARVEAWLVPTTSADELEAEALRRAALDRHAALVAATRARLAGLDPGADPVVQAHTRPAERQGRDGAALIEHLAALQREALAEAQRRAFLGEASQVALDDALLALSTAAPRSHPRAALPERTLALLTPIYSALLLLYTSQRLALVGVTALVALALVALEAFASEPIPDPRPDALTPSG